MSGAIENVVNEAPAGIYTFSSLMSVKSTPSTAVDFSLLMEKLTGKSLLSAFAFAVESVTIIAKLVVSVINALALSKFNRPILS